MLWRTSPANTARLLRRCFNVSSVKCHGIPAPPSHTTRFTFLQPPNEGNIVKAEFIQNNLPVNGSTPFRANCKLKSALEFSPGKRCLSFSSFCISFTRTSFTTICLAGYLQRLLQIPRMRVVVRTGELISLIVIGAFLSPVLSISHSHSHLYERQSDDLQVRMPSPVFIKAEG